MLTTDKKYLASLHPTSKQSFKIEFFKIQLRILFGVPFILRPKSSPDFSVYLIEGYRIHGRLIFKRFNKQKTYLRNMIHRNELESMELHNVCY